jgi:hypothetical protein
MTPINPVLPCFFCKETWGYIKPDRTRPERYCGEPFGVDGVVCGRCYARERRRLARERARGSRPVVVATKRLTHAQRYAAERPGVAARLAAIRAEKVRRYMAGDLSNPTAAELDAVLANVA